MPVPASLSLSPSTKCIRDYEASNLEHESISLPAYEFPECKRSIILDSTSDEESSRSTRVTMLF